MLITSVCKAWQNVYQHKYTLMFRFHLIRSISVFVLLAQLGCKSNPSTTSSNTAIQDIFPLKVGNSWTYLQTYYDTGDTISGTLSVTGEETYHGFHAYFYSLSGPVYNIDYYSGPNVYSVAATDKIHNPHISLHYPMNIGETFLLDSASWDPPYTETLKLIQNSELISTPAGVFNCVHFQLFSGNVLQSTTDSTAIRDDYYAPGIGLVRFRDYNMYNGKRYIYSTVELISYVVK